VGGARGRGEVSADLQRRGEKGEGRTRKKAKILFQRKKKAALAFYWRGKRRVKKGIKTGGGEKHKEGKENFSEGSHVLIQGAQSHRGS